MNSTMMKKTFHNRKEIKKEIIYEVELVKTPQEGARHKRIKLAVNKANQVKNIRDIYGNGYLQKY